MTQMVAGFVNIVDSVGTTKQIVFHVCGLWQLKVLVHGLFLIKQSILTLSVASPYRGRVVAVFP